jgi:hypothetical protein
MRAAASAALGAGTGDTRRDWIDRAAGRGAQVVVVRSGGASSYAAWESELFNRSVGAVYDLGGPLPGGLPETSVERRSDGALVRHGSPVHARFALVDGAVDLEGTEIAAAPGPGLRLLRVDGALTVPSALRGLYPGDTWSGRTVEYTRVHCAGGRLDVVLASDPQLFHGNQTVTARVGGRVVARTTVAPTGRSVLTVPLRPGRGGRCSARLQVARTVVPAHVLAGSTDERELGVHVLRHSFRDA